MLLKQQPASRLASNLSLSHITVPFAIELQEVPRVTETTGKLHFFIVILPFTQDFQETGFIQEDLSCLPPIPRQFRLHVSSTYGENLPASVTEACLLPSHASSGRSDYLRGSDNSTKMYVLILLP